MDWTRGPTIGRGSSATVSIAAAHRSGDVFAVKSAELSLSEFLEREQRILSSIVCPQIIGYKGHSVTFENGKLMYNVFMEYASGGTLVDAIKEHDDGVKIADLGCAKWVDRLVSVSGSSPPAIVGTPLFMAPEVARGEEQGYPADLWALGCTVIEMATGRTPWNDVSDPVSALYRIGFSGEVPEIPICLSEDGKDFLDKCLKRDPRERRSASELLRHSFLEEPKFVLKGIHGHNLDSPVNVLDRGFWDSMEETETTHNSTRKTSPSSPPVQRIRQLCGGTATLSTGVPNWTWDENWVTVRSNGMKEEEKEEEDSFSFCQNDEMLCANEPTTSGMDIDWVSHPYEPTSSNGIGSIDTSNSSSGCGCCYSSCSSRGNSSSNDKNCLFLACCSMEDVSCKNYNLQMDKKILCFLASNFNSLKIL
ncbi:hypothetical protein F0562_014378 [Nyssa sinensis]|uniref:Protein kinase domain-containing protein n=1 Tax=Nyssa sinensis TaxID=561372 RepID=A0A5J4ZRR2_9ASTE|nr:hypothetical protein F0562_014378 [Nyssa sinensis]